VLAPDQTVESLGNDPPKFCAPEPTST
jgi:hypothetical protein